MSDTPTRLYRIGESKRFEFADPTCLRAACFQPTGVTNHRNAKIIYTCEHRMLHGCPSVMNRGFSDANYERRRAENWREDQG